MNNTNANAQVSRKEFLDEFNIDPYEIIGVSTMATKSEIKKAYKYKARILHPDKNLSHDSTPEFKILGVCYEYITTELDTPKTPTFGSSTGWDQLRNNARQPTAVPKQQGSRRGNIDHSQFEGNRKYLIDDDLDFEELTHQMQSRSTSTVYNRNEKVFNVFKDGKFNSKKFNALFEFIKVKQNEGIVATSSDGLLLVDKGTDDFSVGGQSVSAADYKKLKKESLVHPQELLDTIMSEKDIDKIMSKIEKDTKKMTKRKAKELMNKHQAALEPVRHEMSFADAEQLFHTQRLQGMKQEMDRNQQVFNRYGHLYGDELLLAAHQGTLDDSSTCIRGDGRQTGQLTLIKPSGIRRIQ